MNTPSNAVPESNSEAQVIAPTATSVTRPMYWSIRRELWENRSIYIAPLAVACLTLFGFVIATIGRGMATHNLVQRQAVLEEPYTFATGLIMATAFIVGIFYSLDALHGERRDRSILFWKSLPVSDLTTVLAKASIPLVVLPLLTFAIAVITQWIMLLLSTLVLLGSGLSAATLRMAFLWAALPPLAIGVLEKIAFNTKHFAAVLGYRFSGPEAFSFTAPGSSAMHPMSHLELGKFLSAPGLWTGLVVAAIFLAGSVRLRRYREPI